MFGTEGLPGQSTKRDSSNAPFYHSLMCSTFSIYFLISARPALWSLFGGLDIQYAGKLHQYLSSLRWASSMTYPKSGIQLGRIRVTKKRINKVAASGFPISYSGLGNVRQGVRAINLLIARESGCMAGNELLGFIRRDAALIGRLKAVYRRYRIGFFNVQK